MPTQSALNDLKRRLRREGLSGYELEYIENMLAAIRDQETKMAITRQVIRQKRQEGDEQGCMPHLQSLHDLVMLRQFIYRTMLSRILPTPRRSTE